MTHQSFISRMLHSIISLLHQTCRLRSCSFFGNTRLAGTPSLLSLSLSSSHRGCKVCALPFWSGHLFYYLPIVPYILWCFAMSCDVYVTLSISCDVARCGTMWDSDEFLLGFCYDWLSEKVSRKFHQNFCSKVAIRFPRLKLWPDAFLPANKTTIKKCIIFVGCFELFT